MDAAGIEQAALLGMSEGGPLAALFAATYPALAPEVVEDDILHLISKSPELGAPKTADGNGIGAHRKSTNAARPSPDLPFDPVG